MTIMDKSIIEKVFTEAVLSNSVFVEKCGRTTLTAQDKQIIAEFDRTHFEDELMTDSLTAFEEHKKLQLKHKYTEKQGIAVEKWSHGAFITINGKLYNTDDFKHRKKIGLIDDEELNGWVDGLQSAIDESPLTPINVVTHRIGHWDEGHKTGDVIVQKGFASTSYGEGVPVSTDVIDGFDITYYVPSGSKGLLVLPEQFNIFDGDERELLLGRYTRQYVLEQDDDLHTVDVLVLPYR